MTVIKVKIIWLILSVENLFSMKTVNSAQLVLWGLEEFWERQRDGKLEGGNDTFIKVAGVQTKECGHLTPDSKHHRFFTSRKGKFPTQELFNQTTPSKTQWYSKVFFRPACKFKFSISCWLVPQWNPALKTVKMTLQLWTFLRWAFNAAVTFPCELAVFNPRLLLTSALLERNLHAFLRSGGIQTQTPPTSSLQHLSARTTSRALCRPPAR